MKRSYNKRAKFHPQGDAHDCVTKLMYDRYDQ